MHTGAGGTGWHWREDPERRSDTGGAPPWGGDRGLPSSAWTGKEQDVGQHRGGPGVEGHDPTSSSRLREACHRPEEALSLRCRRAAGRSLSITRKEMTWMDEPHLV